MQALPQHSAIPVCPCCCHACHLSLWGFLDVSGSDLHPQGGAGGPVSPRWPWQPWELGGIVPRGYSWLGGTLAPPWCRGLMLVAMGKRGGHGPCCLGRSSAEMAARSCMRSSTCGDRDLGATAIQGRERMSPCPSQPLCPGERAALTMSSWASVSSRATSVGTSSRAVASWKRFSTASLICPSSRVFWVAVLWTWAQWDS